QAFVAAVNQHEANGSVRPGERAVGVGRLYLDHRGYVRGGGGSVNRPGLERALGRGDREAQAHILGGSGGGAVLGVELGTLVGVFLHGAVIRGGAAADLAQNDLAGRGRLDLVGDRYGERIG